MVDLKDQQQQEVEGMLHVRRAPTYATGHANTCLHL